MGVVNATRDSFSDPGHYPDLESRLDLATVHLEAGADIVDIGGQSAITGVAETDVADEISAVVPLVRAVLRRHPSAVISIDTYKPEVAAAALSAGAAIINDISGFRHVRIADVVAEHGAGLVITHNLSRPKQRLTEIDLYRDIAVEVTDFLREKMDLATSRGVELSSIILDPGPDLSKTPYQTVEILRDLERIEALGRPVLLAVSRKDFIGAITMTSPSNRTAGSLAAAAATGLSTNHIYRVHEVKPFIDFIAVHETLTGRREMSRTLELPVDLRREKPRRAHPTERAGDARG